MWPAYCSCGPRTPPGGKGRVPIVHSNTAHHARSRNSRPGPHRGSTPFHEARQYSCNATQVGTRVRITTPRRLSADASALRASRACTYDPPGGLCRARRRLRRARHVLGGCSQPAVPFHENAAYGVDAIGGRTSDGPRHRAEAPARPDKPPNRKRPSAVEDGGSRVRRSSISEGVPRNRHRLLRQSAAARIRLRPRARGQAVGHHARDRRR